MHVTELYNVVYIGLMPLGSERVAQKDQKIDLVLLDLRADLLHSAKMTGQMLMDIEIGDLFDQPARSARCIKLMAAQYAAVCDAEVLH
jgi:hypothetical protein